MSRQQQPPHDHDAERALLGCLLLSAQACMEIIDDEELQAGEFYAPQHQAMFAAITAVWKSGQRVDAVTVHAANPETSTVDMLELQNAVPSISSVRRYCAIVRETALRRRLVQLASEISQEAFRPDGVAEQVIDRGRSGLEQIHAATEALGGELTDYVESPRDLYPNGTGIEATNPWVLPLLLRQQEALIVVAPGGIGKSWLLRQLAYCAENSIHWSIGRALPKFGRQRALLVELEAKKFNVHQSAEALRRGVARQLGVPEDTINEPAVLMRPGGLDIRDPRERAALVRAIRIAKPSLVCMGPLKYLYRMKPGEQYENAAVEAQKVLNDLMAKYGFALALEAHANRSDPGNVAGSARWADWPDVGFSLQVPDKDITQYANLETDVYRFRGNRNPEVFLPGKLIRAQTGSHLPWTCDASDESMILNKLCPTWIQKRW